MLDELKKLSRHFLTIKNSCEFRPFIPNWQKILTLLDVGDSRTLKSYFEHLRDAGLVRSLTKATHKFNQLETAEKVFLNNSNQLYAISSSSPEIGTVRETYFLNMVTERHEVRQPLHGDFLIDDKYLFEVGGKNKSTRQLNHQKNSFLAVDGIEEGIGNKIPLWLFGFLY